MSKLDKLTDADIEVYESRIAKLERALCEVGNVVGSPTLGYALNVERGHVAEMRTQISAIVQQAMQR